VSRHRSVKLAAQKQKKASKQRERTKAHKQGDNPSGGASTLRRNTNNSAGRLPADVISNLRTLAHGLSNSLETILQAAYLLDQSKLDPNGKKWTQLIDTAAQDAARTNREIREILRSQS
jgi:signal transduction histidine kinase